MASYAAASVASMAFKLAETTVSAVCRVTRNDSRLNVMMVPAEEFGKIKEGARKYL